MSHAAGTFFKWIRHDSPYVWESLDSEKGTCIGKFKSYSAHHSFRPADPCHFTLWAKIAKLRLSVELPP